MSKRRHMAVDHYQGPPRRTETVHHASGVVYTIEQWPSLSFKTTISIKANQAKYDELASKGWSVCRQNDRVLVSHKSQAFPGDWVDMIIREYVKPV